MLMIAVVPGLVSCTNADGTLGQRGSPFWYEQSNDAQKKTYFQQLCFSRYGLTEGREFNKCIQDVETTFQIRNGNILLCPLSEKQVSKGLTCLNEVPKYGPDVFF